MNDPDGRASDLRDIQNRLRVETNPERRRILNEAGRKIANESPRIREMRRQLIKAKREGNDQEVRDINEVVMNDRRWQ